MQCILCKNRAEYTPSYDEKQTEIKAAQIKCASCGTYLLPFKEQKTLHIFIADNPAEIVRIRLEKLSSYIRNYNREHGSPPLISFDVMESYGIK
jgi:hypothetical protein